MSVDDTALFLAEMGDVKPLTTNDKVFVSSQQLDTDAHRARRKAAMQNEYLAKLPIEPRLLTPIAPDEIMSYKRNGVQEEVFRHLRLGKYKKQTVLDLHAYRLIQARELLVETIIQAHEKGERNLLIIHGKGVNNKPYPALMKSAVNDWLMQFDQVQAFHSATREQGGTGALFVMLVKSDEQRIVSGETNRKGSGFR
ncbi:DNA endonuclease SmrA [Shewanella japonica]|uniref:DNA endonuclease SmrA n=1 Tax=Shewanella japonica TaxID=93973 RepID=UPI000E717E62|nr:DNA endonuclease SmrA [Shewanella japonica]